MPEDYNSSSEDDDISIADSEPASVKAKDNNNNNRNGPSFLEKQQAQARLIQQREQPRALLPPQPLPQARAQVQPQAQRQGPGVAREGIEPEVVAKKNNAWALSNFFQPQAGDDRPKPAQGGVATYNQDDPRVKVVKVTRMLQKIADKAKKNNELSVVHADITKVVRTSVSIMNDLMEMVKMYANAFESLSAEVQKLNDAIGTETSLDDIRTLSDNTMKDAYMRFDAALRSLDRYLPQNTKSDVQKYQNDIGQVVKKINATV